MAVTSASDSIIGLGVDQGIANCGFSIVELTSTDEIKVLTSGTIITNAKHELSFRILLIHETINRLAKEYNVSILGCEKLFFSPKQKSESNQKGRNKSASIVYTNMATGVLYLIAGENQLHLKEFVPGTVKKYVAGHGRASKEELEEAVKNIVKNLDKEIGTEHEADAIGIGITAVKFKKDLNEKGLEREEKPKKKSSKSKKEEPEEKPKKRKSKSAKDNAEEAPKEKKTKRKKKGEIES